MLKKKRAAIAVATPPMPSINDSQSVQTKETTQKVLFEKNISFENWKDMPFFAQIEKERKEVNKTIGQRYNLNLDNEPNIFQPSKEILQEIEDGKRANVIWTPIKTRTREEVRYNSYEIKNGIQMSQSLIEDNRLPRISSNRTNEFA